MKKLLSVLLIFALCTVMLTACGGSSDGGTTATPETTTAGGGDATQGGDTTAAPSGETYDLIVANSDSSTSLCETYVETLCAMMSEESGGRLQFTFQPGGSLLGATETLDGVKDGAADLCWTAVAFYPGRFPIHEFLGLAGNGITSGQMGCDIIEEIEATIPEAAAEVSDWHIIMSGACTYGPLSTVSKKVEKVSDLVGLQIRAAGTVPSQYVSALGATPVSMPTPDVYEALEKGTIDGMCNDWHNIDCFKLYEAVKYCMRFNMMNCASIFLLMNKDVYNSLDAECKAIVDKYSGNYASDMAGYYWDSCVFWVGDKMEANGVEIYDPTQEFLDAALDENLITPIHEWYVGFLNDAGYDGQALYDSMMAIVEKYKDEHANDLAEEFNYTDWSFTPDDYEG